MRKAEGMRKVLLVSVLFWVCLVVLSGCSDSEYIEVEKFENGVSVGLLVESKDDVDVYLYNGFYYSVSGVNLVLGDVEYIYIDNECSNPFLIKNNVKQRALFDIGEVAYISSDYKYVKFSVYYKVIQETCTPFYNLSGAWVSEVKEVAIPSFMMDGKVVTD